MQLPNKIRNKKDLETALIQTAVNSTGYRPSLRVDGIRGNKTETAIDFIWRRHHFKSEDVPKYAQLANEHVGLSEIAGSKSNSTILKWIKSFFPWAKDDGELAWCAIFINVMLKQCGIKGTGKANARSFLNWGEDVSDAPKKGDIVIFWRESPNSWKGHVGIYWGDNGDYIRCLGGNQRNKVSIANYPKTRILGFRRPA